MKHTNLIDILEAEEVIFKKFSQETTLPKEYFVQRLELAKNELEVLKTMVNSEAVKRHKKVIKAGIKHWERSLKAFD